MSVAHEAPHWYRTQFARSAELAERAERWMPCVSTSISTHHSPYPLALRRGRGCHVEDVDGHVFIDFANQSSSLVLGHGHPGVTISLHAALEQGLGFGAPHETQLELARLLCERIPSVERVRFCATGSEATDLAVRAARAFTRRRKIVKMEGGYHGNHALGEISMAAVPGRCGPAHSPSPVSIDASRPEPAAPDLLLSIFNDADHLEQVLRRARGEVAAVILEPMLGATGMIAPRPGYLADVRELTRAHDVLLVFDEVVTLRLSPGGLQMCAAVEPDLTAMGKMIGGGLALGALGGRSDILGCFAPRTATPVCQATTFGGHPLSLVAGVATLQALDEAAFEHLDRMGAALQETLVAALVRSGVRGSLTGIGSLRLVHFGGSPIENARDSMDALVGAGLIPHLFHLELLRRGVLVSSRLMFCASTPMREVEIAQTGEAVEDALRALRPVIARDRPQLLL